MEKLLIILLTAGVLLLGLKLVASVTVYEFQRGLLYRNGAFSRILGPGKYYYFRPVTTVDILDIRKKLVTLSSQEILTKDPVNVKITLAGFYEIVDPVKARHAAEHYITEFYNHAQLLLRDIVSTLPLDTLVEKTGEIDEQLLTGISEKAEELGLAVTRLAIKDIMLPASLKKAYSGVIEAQKEAQRLLEKTRGEQAALRSLANSSKMYDANPELLQARLIQALESGGNTLVIDFSKTPQVKMASKA